MKTIYAQFDKAAINDLPRALFDGRIIVVQSKTEARRAVDYLSKFQRVGIDTETRPSFRRGSMNPVALLQVSTHDTCFLFRLCQIGLPDSVVGLFTDASVQKIGLSLHDDWAQLRRRVDFEPTASLDLQDFVRRLGVEDMSLQKLYANFFHQKISKGQRLTNWEADILTPAQKAYAATDAWACLQLYDEINHLLESKEYELL